MKAWLTFNAATRRELLSVLADRADVVKELEREAGHYVSYKASLDAIGSAADRRDAFGALQRAVREACYAAADVRATYGGNLTRERLADLDTLDAIADRLDGVAVAPAKTKRGPARDAARLTLEGNVAAILRHAGIRCTGADKGTLARVLGAIYTAVGIPVPMRLGGEAARAIKLDAGF